MSPMRRMYSLLKSRGSKHFGSITHCDPSFDLLTISCRLSARRDCQGPPTDKKWSRNPRFPGFARDLRVIQDWKDSGGGETAGAQRRVRFVLVLLGKWVVEGPPC